MQTRLTERAHDVDPLTMTHGPRRIVDSVLIGMVVVASVATGCGGDGDTSTSVGGGDVQPATTSTDPAGVEGRGAATQGDGDTGTSVGGGEAQPTATSTDPAGVAGGGAAAQGDGDPAGIPACVDVAAVAAVIGHDMAISDEPVAANWCSYVGANSHYGGVDFGHFGSMRAQIEQRLDAGFEAVPGVGEEATWTGEPGSGQLAVRTSDDVGYIIEVYGDVDRDLKALAIALAEIIIDG